MKNKGFTLIESLVVVTVVSLLIAFGSSYLKSTSSGINEIELINSIRSVADVIDDANKDTFVTTYATTDVAKLKGFPSLIKYQDRNQSLTYKNQITITTGLIPRNIVLSQARIGKAEQGYFIGIAGMTKRMCFNLLYDLWDEFEIIEFDSSISKSFDQSLIPITKTCQEKPLGKGGILRLYRI